MHSYSQRLITLQCRLLTTVWFGAALNHRAVPLCNQMISVREVNREQAAIRRDS